MKNRIQLRKVIAVLLALLIAFMAHYYLVYESSHFIHECTGEECQICYELHVAEAMLNQLGGAVLTVFGSIILVMAIKRVVKIFICVYKERTLILDKVRMDN